MIHIVILYGHTPLSLVVWNRSNGLNLDGKVSRELAHLHRRSGRLGVRKHGLINLIHSSIIAHVCEEHSDLEHVRPRCSRLLEDGSNVADDLGLDLI